MLDHHHQHRAIQQKMFYANKYVDIVLWSSDFSQHENSSCQPMWVELTNLHHRQHVQSVVAVVELLLGPAIHFPGMADKLVHYSNPRILIRWAMGNVIPEFIALRRPCGQLFQSITFLNHPDTCFKCKQLGHFVKDCQNQPHSPNFVNRVIQSQRGVAVVGRRDQASSGDDRGDSSGPVLTPASNVVIHPLVDPLDCLNNCGVGAVDGELGSRLEPAVRLMEEVGEPRISVLGSCPVQNICPSSRPVDCPTLPTVEGVDLGFSVATFVGPLPVGDAAWYDNGHTSNEDSSLAPTHDIRRSKPSARRRWGSVAETGLLSLMGGFVSGSVRFIDQALPRALLVLELGSGTSFLYRALIFCPCF
ncbi:unnamed protein product [Calypogeia fissa]